jgi:hypothetical protein
MKTTNNTPTATDLAAEVKRAIETAPSHAPLIAAKAKLEDLTAKANREAEEIERLSKEFAAGKDDTAEHAKDLLAGKEISERRIKDAIQSAHRRAEVIREAINIQTRDVRELEGKLSSEVYSTLKKVRQPLVTRIAEALKVLRAAATEEANITRALNEARVFRAGFDDGVAFAPCGSSAFDQQWMSARKAQGYAV